MNSTIICIGELLIDFFCKDVDIDLIDGNSFEKQAGGAPANVCATIAKLGGHAVFSGKVGNDPFGHFLKKSLDEVKVDTSMLLFDEKRPTTITFVSLQANGERDFVFNRGADAFLFESEIDKVKMQQAKIVHFGSATALLDDPFQSTYINTMNYYKKERKFISFDPNYRKDLWGKSTSKFILLAKEAIALADFVKLSEDEIKLISGKKDVVEGLAYLHQICDGVIAVTLGKAGTLISNGVESEVVPSINIHAIDSTGAGDAFVGATLFQIAKEIYPQNIGNQFEQLKKVISFSNKVGAIVCTKIGAISAIPSFDRYYLKMG